MDFFAKQAALQQLDKVGDPLTALATHVDWELFRPTLELLRDKPRKSAAGARGYDLVMMFKLLVFQSLHNLSDEATERAAIDRLSMRRFLGLELEDKVPDRNTIWLFREGLRKAGLLDRLFSAFDTFLRANGFEARRGQAVDATIVPSRVTRNAPADREQLDGGEVPADWSENKRRQKDLDARRTRKNFVPYFGYKGHVSVDVGHKFIRRYAVTTAQVHDLNKIGDVLDSVNTSRDVYADKAYRSADVSRMLAERGFRDRVLRVKKRKKPMSVRTKESNRRNSRVRVRAEHVFGAMKQKMGTTVIRTVGLARATGKLCLRFLGYNIGRYAGLVAAA